MFETINQSDKTYCDNPEKVRTASRGILVENGKILLSHELNTGVYMSPGGGLEKNESLEECCIRELQEETGYTVKPVKQFLKINEFCLGVLYVSNYFICEIVGECPTSLTDIEIEHGTVPEWVEIEEALKIFGDYPSKTPDIASLYLREFTTLNKYKESFLV